jgi:L-threonylcarbamoyladenylate synthase
MEMARHCVAGWPAVAEELARAFWPGPLTLVLPRSEVIPHSVTAGGRTVGVRWPAHPLIQAVIRRCGFPLAAPSANYSTELSPTTAGHVYKSLAGQIPLILDGGACQVGIESTVLAIEEDGVRILRPGMIHEESLQGVIGSRAEVASPAVSGEVAASPGLMPKHYAPRARLVVLSWESDAHLERELAGLGASPSSTWVLAYHHIPSAERFGQVCVIPHDAVAFGRAIYAELHRCDEQGAQWIVVEALPESSEWRALRDRLTRASASEG